MDIEKNTTRAIIVKLKTKDIIKKKKFSQREEKFRFFFCFLFVPRTDK